MINITLLKIFKSNYCKVVFIFSLIGLFFLIPKKIFYGNYLIIGIIFIFLSSLLVTCLIRDIKERVHSAKAGGASFLGIIVIVVGLGAIQSCSIGAPICGASIGIGVLSFIFPNIALNFLEKYSLIIIIISLFFQVFSLYFMNCFNKIKGGLK